MSNKVLLLVSEMTSGGAERVASMLSNAWVTHGKQVVLMLVSSGQKECFYPLSPQVRLFCLADLVSSQGRDLSDQWRRLFVLRRFIITERPDVIVSFLPHVNVAAVIASIGLKVPIIVCERNDPFAMPTAYSKKLACCLTYPLADALMVQTQAVADKYISSGLPLRRLRVIPNPIPEKMMGIHHHLDGSVKKRLLGVGRLEDQKQFCVLIKVFASLAKKYPDWTLRVVGEGSLREVLQKQIIDLGCEECIELVGRKSNIEEELAGADVYALTSKHEGFPNALLEAMIAGLACVTFDCPSGPREISMDGQVALLVPLNDEQGLEQALERVMLDAGLRKLLGDSARASVIERFSFDKILKQWDLLFHEVRGRK